jgi:hypothetical protein
MIKKESPQLEKFITVKCSESISLYLYIKWLFVSFSDNDRKDKKKLERFERIDRVI